MAKLSKIVRNKRQIEECKRHTSLRKDLRKQVRNESLSDEQRLQAQLRLQKLPRRTSEVRIRNRCELTGRPRGHLRAFRMSRIAFRELAGRGLIPGITKSSW